MIFFIICYIVLSFLGYLFHYVLHQRWSGPFYRAHMNHHLKKYPHTDFFSETYRDAGKDNTVFLFTIAFSPLIVLATLLTITETISIMHGVFILSQMAILGWLNNSIHDACHLKISMWDKFPFFERIRTIHFIHHYDMAKNFGIFSFEWDFVFRTFKRY